MRRCRTASALPQVEAWLKALVTSASSPGDCSGATNLAFHQVSGLSSGFGVRGAGCGVRDSGCGLGQSIARVGRDFLVGVELGHVLPVHPELDLQRDFTGMAREHLPKQGMPKSCQPFRAIHGFRRHTSCAYFLSTYAMILHAPLNVGQAALQLGWLVASQGECATTLTHGLSMPSLECGSR